MCKTTFRTFRSILPHGNTLVHVCISGAAATRYRSTPQRISSDTASISGILFRGRERIFRLYLLAFSRGLGDNTLRVGRPRLYVRELRRAHLQYVCRGRVSSEQRLYETR